MIIGGIVVAVVLVALSVVLVTRRAAHGDLHSVEGYHRSVHTLESINTHPADAGRATQPSLAVRSAYPDSAIRVGGGTPSVRVTDAPPTSLPPGALAAEAPVTFDDTSPVAPTMPSHEVPGSRRDKAMVSINHRPRRLAAPALAVAAVTVLVVVLLLTGSHAVAPTHHHRHHPTSVTKGAPGGALAHPGGATTTAAPSTTPPPVSLPRSSTSATAIYTVTASTYALSFTATSGPCWVDATNSTTGATVFSGVLEPGKNQSVTTSGPLTVIVGAPTVLAVAVNGSPVALPSGFETPFTMMFVTPS